MKLFKNIIFLLNKVRIFLVKINAKLKNIIKYFFVDIIIGSF